MEKFIYQNTNTLSSTINDNINILHSDGNIPARKSMLSMSFQFLGVATVSGCLLLILKIQQKRELANKMAQHYCNQNNLQFLDGTVAFRGFHFNWVQLVIVFHFYFDYSLNDTDRYTGFISLAGNQIQNIYADQYHIHL